MPAKFAISDQFMVARGHLSPEQVLVLDRALAHHGLPATSPHTIPAQLAYVCLKCGSIAEAADSETRDFTVENFDMTCCGLTVIFHSKMGTLVDPANLTIVQES